MPSPLLRRLRRVVAVGPAVLTSWAVLVGLPLAPTTGHPGHLDTTTIALSGAQARSTSGPATASARAGWRRSVGVDRGTQMVALTWDATTPPDAVARIRSRGTDGAWTGWERLDADETVDEGPDPGAAERGNGRHGVGPIWLGHDGAQQVEVAVDKGSFGDLSMEAMRWIEPTGPSGQPAGAEPAGPAIIGRDAWAPGGWRGDNPGCPAKPTWSDSLKFAVVHHTVNANDYTKAQVPGVLAGIYRYHTDGLGWCDIAYNFLIDRFGRVWQGRSGDIGLPILGGHSKGFNTDSVGVAFLGQYQPGASPAAANPSDAALTSLYELLAWKFSIHGVNPRGHATVTSNGSTKYAEGTVVTIPTIIGHQSVSLTSCPGANLAAHLGEVRPAVAFLKALAATPDAWKPFVNPRDNAQQQYRDILGREASNTEAAYWADRVQRLDDPTAPMTVDLVTSPEADFRTWSIPRLYFAYFQRRPDHGGLRYWWGRLRGGTASLGGISQAFAESSEFMTTYGSLNDDAFVRRVYQNVLGRAPDQSGLDFWKGQLQSGNRNRGQVMTGFSESAEFHRRTFAEVGSIVVHETLLGRAPTASEYTKWRTAFASSGSVASRVTEILRSSEYARRIANR
jgi:hypothetical protein